MERKKQDKMVPIVYRSLTEPQGLARPEDTSAGKHFALNSVPETPQTKTDPTICGRQGRRRNFFFGPGIQAGISLPKHVRAKRKAGHRSIHRYSAEY